MGIIFLFIGVWIMVSGIMDIRESKKIPDSCAADDSSFEESVSDEGAAIEVNAA